MTVLHWIYLFIYLFCQSFSLNNHLYAAVQFIGFWNNVYLQNYDDWWLIYTQKAVGKDQENIITFE